LLSPIPDHAFFEQPQDLKEVVAEQALELRLPVVIADDEVRAVVFDVPRQTGSGDDRSCRASMRRRPWDQSGDTGTARVLVI
jgi:hypothetical protein